MLDPSFSLHPACLRPSPVSVASREIKNRDRGLHFGRLNADFIRLVYLHATKETKNYLDVIDPVDEEAGHEADAAGGRRDRDFLIQRSRFLAALKTRLGLILAKAVAMRVMINATGCPAPYSAEVAVLTTILAP